MGGLHRIMTERFCTFLWSQNQTSMTWGKLFVEYLACKVLKLRVQLAGATLYESNCGPVSCECQLDTKLDIVYAKGVKALSKFAESL